MPEQKVDVDTSILDGLDFEVVCNVTVRIEYRGWGRSRWGSPSNDCENPAAWMLTCRGCGIELYMCEPHRSSLSQVIARCDRCGLKAPQLTTVFWVRKLPAGGQS